MNDGDKNRPGDRNEPVVQQERGKYGDKPQGRLSGTGKPPIGEAKKPEAKQD
jgi:hypothetical protein